MVCASLRGKSNVSSMISWVELKICTLPLYASELVDNKMSLIQLCNAIFLSLC